MSWRGLGAAARGLNAVLRLRRRATRSSRTCRCATSPSRCSRSTSRCRCGAVVNFAESLRTVQEDLRELSPQIFFGVPRIWEKFHASIQTKLREAGGLRLALYRRAMASLRAVAARPRRSGARLERARWAVWYVLILRALLNFIGLRRCRVAISSGAPIAPEILKFFRVLGVPIREAYGLTEASGATTMQPGDALAGRHRRRALPRRRGQARRRRRDPDQGRRRVPRLLQEPGGDARGDRRRRLAAHRRRRALGRQRGRPRAAHRRPQEGHHDHRRRQEHHAVGDREHAALLAVHQGGDRRSPTGAASSRR